MATILEKFVTQYTTEFDGSGLQKLQSGIDKAEVRLKTLGTRMATVGAGLTALNASAAKQANDFKKSVDKIVGLVGVERSVIEGWIPQMQKLSRETNQSLQDIIDATFDITSAGLRGSAALDAMRASALGAKAGLGDMKTIADVATSAVNAYGKDVLSASGAVDILTTAIRVGKLEPSSLAGALSQVVGQAQSMGIEFHELNAAIAAMSITGVQASDAVTRIRSILTGLSKPTTNAEKALGKFGLTVADVRDGLGEDFIGTLVSLREKFADNEEGTKQFSLFLTQVFGRVEAVNGVIALLGGSMDQTKQIFDDVADSAGATAIAAAEQEDSLKSLQSTAERLGIAIGKDLLKQYGWLADVLEKVEAKIVSGEGRMGKFLSLLLGAGPIIAGAGIGFTGLSIAISGVRKAVLLLRGAMTLLLAHPIWAAILAGGAILAWFLTMEDKVDKLKETWMRFIGDVEGAEKSSLKRRLDNYTQFLADKSYADLEALRREKHLEAMRISADIAKLKSETAPQDMQYIGPRLRRMEAERAAVLAEKGSISRQMRTVGGPASLGDLEAWWQGVLGGGKKDDPTKGGGGRNRRATGGSLVPGLGINTGTPGSSILVKELRLANQSWSEMDERIIIAKERTRQLLAEMARLAPSQQRAFDGIAQLLGGSPTAGGDVLSALFGGGAGGGPFRQLFGRIRGSGLLGKLAGSGIGKLAGKALPIIGQVSMVNDAIKGLFGVNPLREAGKAAGKFFGSIGRKLGLLKKKARKAGKSIPEGLGEGIAISKHIPIDELESVLARMRGKLGGSGGRPGTFFSSLFDPKTSVNFRSGAPLPQRYSTQTNSSTNNTMNNTITINGAGMNPQEVARAVRKELASGMFTATMDVSG